MSSSFDITTVRDKFPSLKQKQVYFDNAGGSQILGSVVTSICDYLLNTNVQLGASYPVGQQSTQKYREGYAAAAKYINASPEEIVLGASTTQLFRNLSAAIKWQSGDELIVSSLDHEANIAPWVSVSERLGLKLKWWVPKDRLNPKLEASDLKSLMTEKTRLVTCTHASNILGTIHDIRAIAGVVHSVPGAMLCVDAVAYAPHRQLDVKELDVDFYAFSWYKVYGPHISLLYGSAKAQEQVGSLGHYFNPSATLEGKLGLAASSYEMTQAIPKVLDYFGSGGDAAATWNAMQRHEEQLAEFLLGYLRERKDVTIFGEPSADGEKRVPTISFVIEGQNSQDVVERVEKVSDFGFRWGAFYSNRLVENVLGLGKDGVIRVSMVHYNTVDEIRAFVKKLDEVVPPSA